MKFCYRIKLSEFHPGSSVQISCSKNLKSIFQGKIKSLRIQINTIFNPLQRIIRRNEKAPKIHCFTSNSTITNRTKSNAFGIKNQEPRNSLLVPPTALGPPPLELGDGASTAGAEEQYRSAIRRRHLPELRPEALVVWIGLAAALPRQPVDLLGRAPDGLLILQFQIELHRLLQSLASRPVALARSRPEAELGGEDAGGEENDEAEEVGEVELDVVDMEGGGREEERKGVEDVGKIGGEEEGAGEEDEDEDEEVESGRRGMLAGKGVRVRVRV